VAFDYLLGTDGEPPSAAKPHPATGTTARDVAELMHHAVAAALVIDGSDSAVALCGATVRVDSTRRFSASGPNHGLAHEMCLALVVAARSAADSAPR
jgi:hypothetical protein